MSNAMGAKSDKASEVVILSEKFNKIAMELREIIDLSIIIRKESPQSKHQTILLWEEFLSHLFGYIRQRSKETKDNLLAGISLTRLKLF